MQPKSLPAHAWSAIRSNWLPIFIFLALGAALLFGKPALLALTSYINGVDATAVAAKLPANMTSAEVAASQQANGWMPAGLGSKFLFAAGFFFLFIFLDWVAQSIAEPRGKKWVKGEGQQTFLRLTPAEQFREYRDGRWQLTALACASILAAALIA